MLAQTIAHIVDFSARRRWAVIAFGVVLAIVSGLFAITHFSINTDVETLISRELPWRERQIDMMKAFPDKGLAVIVRAPTPEGAQEAASALAGQLAADPSLFRGVVQPDSGAFFEQNGLLFQPLADVQNGMAGLVRARPLVGSLAADPTLHGVMRALTFMATGVQEGEVKLDQLRWPLTMANRTFDDALAGTATQFSWQTLAAGAPPPDERLRNLIQAEPVLDFSQLEPGKKARDAIMAAAGTLKLAERYGADVQITGQVALNDSQFAVVQDSAVRDTLIATVSVLVILWLALRSWRIILPVFFSLMVGLAVTAALGILMVGSFNLISIAFFVLFVGIGVDFGIQLSVRYRSERYNRDDLFGALHNAAMKAGTPLALAAAATAVGFLAFLPTSYRGLSELGLIAGVGMIVAFFTSITFAPALLTVLDPAAEPNPVGFKALAPIDHFLHRHRKVVIVLVFLVVLAGIPLLLQLRFDFDPINLQAPDSPSVVTYRSLSHDPQISTMNADVIAGDVQASRAVVQHVAPLPEVERTLTIETLIPTDQDAKIAAIRTAAEKLLPSLDPDEMAPAPTGEDTVKQMGRAAAELRQVASDTQSEAATLSRDLAGKLDRAAADPAVLARLDAALVPTLKYNLGRLAKSLDPQPITADSLPPDLRSRWIDPNGRARVQIVPKGDASNSDVLSAFARAVLGVEPAATGPAISYYESGRTVVEAFILAGAVALVAIAVLLFVALRRFTDVALTLLPLILAGAVTLEIAVLTGLQLNFANIIALPLLLGVGVAFKIYYTIAWRKGAMNLLESALTRAVVFSAATNAAAFGSMWASHYPGMSSMGKLMALALMCTMAFAVLFQPVLMGPPRNPDPHADV